MSSELVEDPVLRQRSRLSQEDDVLRNELSAEPRPGSRALPTSIEERFEGLPSRSRS